MKKIKTFVALAIMAVCCIVVASCDEIIAYTLEGYWEGDMYMSYAYNNRVYDATYTDIEFIGDPCKSASGRGYWYDEYDDGDYFYSSISWTVKDQIIYITIHEDGTELKIRDYTISDDLFKGWIDYYDYNGNAKQREFRMRHLDSPHWTSPEPGHHYDSYSKKSSIETRSVDGSEEKPVRFIR